MSEQSPKLIDSDVEFRIFQDDEFCSGSTVRGDGEHYAAVYGQDGDVERQTSISFSFKGFLSDEQIQRAIAALQPSSAADAKPVAWTNAENIALLARGFPATAWATQHSPDSVALYAQPHPSQQAGAEEAFREGYEVGYCDGQALDPVNDADASWATYLAALKPVEG